MIAILAAAGVFMCTGPESPAKPTSATAGSSAVAPKKPDCGPPAAKKTSGRQHHRRRQAHTSADTQPV